MNRSVKLLTTFLPFISLTTGSRSSVSSTGETTAGVFLHESSLTRYVLGQCHFNVSSTTYHRIQKLIDSAYKYDYEPYSKKEEGE